MKKTIALLLSLTLVFSLASPSFAESDPGPKTETGIIQADGIPVILAFLNRGDQVTVTEAVDEKTSQAETEQGSGTIETQLLRFEGEPEYETWMGYAHYNTALYASYELCGTPAQTLKANTKLWVLEELEDCFAVTLLDPDAPQEEPEQAEKEEEQTEEEEEQTVFFAKKKQVSKTFIQYDSYDEGGSSGGSGSGPQDGGDISMAYYTLIPLADVVTEEEEKTGPAQARVDGAKLILTRLQKGDAVQLITEEDAAPEIEGYLPILMDGKIAYIPQGWVLREGEEAFEAWNGFASYKFQIFDNYLLRGEEMKQVYANSKLTVLWDNGEVCLVQLNDKEGTIGFASSATLLKTPVVYGDDSGSSSGSSTDAWTPPVL